jgi:hypothetical protein
MNSYPNNTNRAQDNSINYMESNNSVSTAYICGSKYKKIKQKFNKNLIKK